MNVAVYPGSFDPITLGHIDIIQRTLTFVDRLYIAIGHNESKRPLFSLQTRRRIIQEALASENLLAAPASSFEDTPEPIDKAGETAKIAIDEFRGLLIDYAQKRKANMIVRGIRAFADFEYEFQMASMNRKINDRVVTVFMSTSDQYHFVSSQLVKEVAANQGDLQRFVAAPTRHELIRYFSSPKKTPTKS